MNEDDNIDSEKKLTDDELFLQSLVELSKDNVVSDDDYSFSQLDDLDLNIDDDVYKEQLQLSASSVRTLKDSMSKLNLIDNELSLFNEEVVFDRKSLVTLIGKPFILEYDEVKDKIFCVGDDGNIADMLSDIESIKPSDADEWLSNRLPEPTFTTTYVNNRAMEKESRAVYKLIAYSVIFKPEWSSEFNKMLSSYDYEALIVPESKVRNYSLFSELLAYVSSNARILGKYVLSACNAKFVHQKKKVDPSYASLLSSAEVIELETLCLKRSSLIRKSQIDLSNTEMSWQKGQINFSLSNDINKIFEGDYSLDNLSDSNVKNVAFKKKCGLLFKTSLFNANVLSEADFNAITKLSNSLAREHLDIDAKSLIPESKVYDFKVLTAKLKKTCVKLRISQYKRNAVSKIRNSDERYDVIIRAKR